MQKDRDISQLDSQEYKHALNAVVEGYDGRSFVLQNESSNLLSISLRQGQKVIGHLYIPSLEITIAFTTNSNGDDEIIYWKTINYNDNRFNYEDSENNTIEAIPLELVTPTAITNYNVLVSSNFSWNIVNKINITYKITDCTLNLYFNDGINPDRFIYFNLSDLSLHQDFKQVNISTLNTCNVEYFDYIDVNKTKFNQSVTFPNIELTEEIGGNLQEGVYQIYTSYSTSKGISLSSYSSSDVFPIFEKIEKTIEGSEYITNKAIKIKLSNITVNSYYKYINIVVGKTINNYTMYNQIATLPIKGTELEYIYTSDVDSITKSEADILTLYPYYKHSGVLSTSNNYLFRANVSEYEKINIQRISNKIELEAVTIRVKEDFYKNPNNSKYKTYIRDEVYGFGFELILDEGEITAVGHIPGRKANSIDMQDAVNTSDIIDNNRKKNWQVNNTAYKTSSPNTNETWETFDFAYWESNEKYPNNPEIWGDLCNQNIRHHKFPDCNISHIHDGNNINVTDVYNKETYLFPIGVRVKSNIEQILNQSVVDGIITLKQLKRIKGYRIVRINRAGNKSIIAKGMLYDMWSYEKPSVYNEEDVCSTKTKYYYPNYGFNDLRDDPFISKTSDHYKYFEFNRGSQTPLLQKFVNEGKYTFHSPDTHFAQPTLGNILKLESEEYGESKGYFNVAENQAQYKLLTSNHYNIATLIAKFIANNTDISNDNNSNIGTSIGSNLGSIAGEVALPGVGGSIGGLVGGLVGSFLGTDTNVTGQLQKNGIILYQTEKIIQLFKNLADYQKLQYQYQAIGKYKAYKPITAGNRQRKINNSAYLTPNKQSVNNVFINNTFRESSVYLDVDRYLAVPTVQDTSRNKLTSTSNATVSSLCKKYKVIIPPEAINGGSFISILYEKCEEGGYNYFVKAGEYTIYSLSKLEFLGDNVVEKNITVTELECSECLAMNPTTVTECNCKGQEITSTISSYYGSIKVDKISQYGGILNNEYISASQVLNINDKPVIFGGDTFITPFALKRKHSFFNTTTYGLPDDTDIFYQDLGNVGYPTYYFNTKENNKDFKPNLSLLLSLQSLTTLGVPTWSFWDSIFGNNDNFNFFSSVINYFSEVAFEPTLWIKAPSFYLDCYDNTSRSKPLTAFSFEPVKGVMYLYYYGIPYFYCESDINTFYRTSKNNKELDFYPHQEDLNYWLQEKNVSINNDNFYFYDKTYSKQNKSTFHYTNDINFKPYADCKVTYPNRVIYSLQSSELDNSDVRDNYLINRALDYYDFGLVNGKLTGIHGIESDKVLVTFENNTQIFSAYNTLETEQGLVQIGNGGIFRSKPQEFSKTTLGYLGSQHSAFLSTEFGHILVDAKRGQVFLIGVNGNGVTELTKDKMRNWFKNHLPFTIDKYYNNVNIDANYSGIGLSLCFDKRYNRILLTKLDYEPKIKDIRCVNNKFYYGDTEVSLTDRRYFVNKSFTISYNFNTNSWTSFHSYTPNYYIENTNYFMTGSSNNIYSHHLTNKSYQVFNGKLFPFEIELNDKFTLNNKVLSSVSYYLDVVRFHNDGAVYYNNNVGFNKAIIYNSNQTTGILELITTDNNNLFENKKYPILAYDSTKVLQVNKEGRYSFNQFKNRRKGNSPIFLEEKNGVNKHINIEAIDTTLANNNYNPIRDTFNNVKLINDKHSNYKMAFKLADFNQANSMR